MTLSDLTDIASIISSILALISLVFIWHELRETTRLTKASNTRSLVELSSPFNLLLARDREVAELWLKGGRQFADLDDVDKWRYRFLLFHSLTLQENIFYQNAKKLMDEEAYNSWMRSFEEFVQEHNLDQHWEQLEHYYQSDFAACVKRLLERQDCVGRKGRDRVED
jgi:hypothetical protein